MATKPLQRHRKKSRDERSPARKARRRTAPAPYHHGDLHAALLQAAETILERDGLAGLTLRAAAREAGVSHAAPTHHFGDMTGLLSELAASGFRKFAAALAAATAAEPLAVDRMNAMGEAYVDFAREHPSMFLLMFRSERLDPTRPALRQALEESSALLTRGVTERRAGAPSTPLSLVADIARAWSMVHGFAMLMIDHRLNTLAAYLPQGMTERDLLRAMLRGK